MAKEMKLTKEEKTKQLLEEIRSFIEKCRRIFYKWYNKISGENYGLLIVLAGEPAEYESPKPYFESHHKMFIVEEAKIQKLCKLVAEKWGIQD